MAPLRTHQGSAEGSTAAPAGIALSQNQLTFIGLAAGPDPENRAFRIINSGPVGSTLNYTILANQSWWKTSPAGGSLPAGGSVIVTVSAITTGMVAGVYDGVISVIDSAANNSPRTIYARLNLNGYASIETARITSKSPDLSGYDLVHVQASGHAYGPVAAPDGYYGTRLLVLMDRAALGTGETFDLTTSGWTAQYGLYDRPDLFPTHHSAALREQGQPSIISWSANGDFRVLPGGHLNMSARVHNPGEFSGAADISAGVINSPHTASIRAIASEARANPYVNGLLTIQLSHDTIVTLDTIDPLTINYAVTGTAQSGTDFVPLSGAVTILPNSSTAVIPVIPKDTLTGTGGTVNVTLTGGSGYVLGTEKTATVVVIKSTPAQCTISNLTDITDQDAAAFELAAPNTPAFAFSPPYVESTLSSRIPGLQSDIQVRLGITTSRTSGYRPFAYQAHFYELRQKLIAIQAAVDREPSQAAACQDLKARIDWEVDTKHGIARDPQNGLPKVNPASASGHTTKPSTAIDLSGIRNLSLSQQILIDQLARKNLLKRPSATDRVHFTLGGEPNKQTLQLTAHSPLNVMMTDPAGRRIGYDPDTSSVINEVGNSAFYSGPNTEPQYLEVAATLTGPYSITGIGHAVGPYSITVETVGEEGTIIDSSTVQGSISIGQRISMNVRNPIDEAQAFVTQHYVDFLEREPDQDGLNYWAGQISECGADEACISNRRIGVSNAFFYEQEYQQTASYVFLLYRAAFGNDQPFPNTDFFDTTLSDGLRAEAKKLPGYFSFVTDRAQVVGGSNLAQTQQALANSFVQRTEFVSKYPLSLSGAHFVTAVLATIQGSSGVDLSSQSAILNMHFNNGGRGLVMLHLANDYWNGCNRLPGSPPAPCVPPGFGAAVDNRPFIDAEYNRSFVFSQYAGYLGRNGDIGGLKFWLNEVSKAPPRDVAKQHAMVCSFITSAEYQQRFSPVVTHFNSECPP